MLRDLQTYKKLAEILLNVYKIGNSFIKIKAGIFNNARFHIFRLSVI